jgi:hypothetical protein
MSLLPSDRVPALIVSVVEGTHCCVLHNKMRDSQVMVTLDASNLVQRKNAATATASFAVVSAAGREQYQY